MDGFSTAYAVIKSSLLSLLEAASEMDETCT